MQTMHYGNTALFFLPPISSKTLIFFTCVPHTSEQLLPNDNLPLELFQIARKRIIP